MPACVFFGTTKDEDISLDMFDTLVAFFRSLIVEDNVKVFYTTAKSDFDFMCEVAVDILRDRYKDVELVKIAGKNERKHREFPPYDRIIYFENNNYMKRCIYAAHLSDHILFDKVATNGLLDRFFLIIGLSKRMNKEECAFNSLKGLMGIQEDL